MSPTFHHPSFTLIGIVTLLFVSNLVPYHVQCDSTFYTPRQSPFRLFARSRANVFASTGARSLAKHLPSLPQTISISQLLGSVPAVSHAAGPYHLSPGAYHPAPIPQYPPSSSNSGGYSGFTLLPGIPSQSNFGLPNLPIPVYHHECEYNVDPVIDEMLNRMEMHLPKEKITVQNAGVITIIDAHITRFGELTRLHSSCARKLNEEGTVVLMPFEAEIRPAQVAAKLKANVYVTDIWGDYGANFSHIRMNGTLEANLLEERMSVVRFNITSSQVVSDSIVFSYVPRWILDLVRSYFDNDNTEMYQQLAQLIVQREADNYRNYALIRECMANPMPVIQSREDEERLPMNRL